MCFHEWPLSRRVSRASQQRQKQAKSLRAVPASPARWRAEHCLPQTRSTAGDTSVNGSTAMCAVRKPTFTVGPKSPPFMQNSKLLVPVRPSHETPFLFLCNPYGNLVK